MQANDLVDAGGNTLLGVPANTYYSKTECDAAFQPKGDYQPAGNYQPAGDYAAATHTHDDRYYQKTETKKIEVMTEAAYNALGSKDANTIYMLT